MHLQLVTFYSFIINLQFTTFHRPVPFFFSFLFFQRSMSSLFFLLKQNNVMRVRTHVSLASRGEKELKAILFNR